MTENYNFDARITKIFTENKLEEYLTEDIKSKLHALADIMLEVNEKMNLTAIKEPDAVILRHFADSLTVCKHIQSGAKVADIGSGAGFPAFPLAIARPDISITAFDSTAKKINYINETAGKLGLANLRGVSIRAEDGAHKEEYREKFDFVCARAVAALPTLCEYCIPYVKKGGIFAAMKAKSAEEELSAAKKAISTLGGKLVKSEEIQLFADFEETPLYRDILIIEKSENTPKNYPRNNAQISKKPL